MDKDLKIVFACVATYAVIGFNTFGFKYHRDASVDGVQSRHTDAALAGLAWPFYWPARWSLQFWEPTPPVTNTVYVTNVVREPFPWIVQPFQPVPFTPPTNFSFGAPGACLTITNNLYRWIP